jgi:secondary thiamine-phosphate synthase enzyme
MIMVIQQQLSQRTRGHGDMHDLTDAVADAVGRSRIRAGVVHVSHMGSTGAIGLVEFEPGLKKDLPSLLDRLMPPSREYAHEQTWHDGNGHSHLQATLLGQSVTIPIADGRLLLGTWQQIFLLECDARARDRTIVVTVMGE